MSRRLKLVAGQLVKVDGPANTPIDIYAADRAKIAATDWSAVHIRGDRSRPIDLPTRTSRSGWGLRP